MFGRGLGLMATEPIEANQPFCARSILRNVCVHSFKYTFKVGLVEASKFLVFLKVKLTYIIYFRQLSKELSH